MLLTRRTLIAMMGSTPLLAAPSMAVAAAAVHKVFWQTWPLGEEKPEICASGQCSLQRFQDAIFPAMTKNYGACYVRAVKI